MKVSTRGRYGLRAMVELALRWNEGPVMLKSVADMQHVSAKYLEQILTQLKHAGLVRVQRGSKGGFMLAREPSSIPLSEILMALEGDFSLVDCLASEEVCEWTEDCVTRTVWADLSAVLAAKLESITLEDLTRRTRKGAKRASPRRGRRKPA